MKLKNILMLMAAMCGLFFAGGADATCSNYTSYTDGQTLSASSLNSLQTNYTNCVNAVLDGDTFTGNMLWHSGADALFYSDTGSTLKGAIYGDGAEAILPIGGSAANCRLSVSGSTLTINGTGGAALSATNPCVIGLNNNQNGSTKTVYFTSNVTVTFGASSDTDGNLFGIVDANWADVMPFFLGIIQDASEGSYFIISRVPLEVSGSSTPFLCQKGDTSCDSYNDGMILATGLTLSDWTAEEIFPVGWFYGTYATSGGAWTFSLSNSINGLYAGFNKNYLKQKFAMSQAQNGGGGTAADTGSHILLNGGTSVPQCTTEEVSYQWHENNQVTVEHLCNGDAGTDGSGSVAYSVALPYARETGSDAANLGLGSFAGPSITQFIYGFVTTASPSIWSFQRNSSASAVTNWLLSDNGNGTRANHAQINYLVDIN